MFSTTPEGFDIFCQRMQNAIRHMTIFRTWGLKMEPYWIRHYCKGDVVLSNGYGFGDAGSSAFSACLKGRRVLVVSSFAETIKSQYKKREFIYPSSDTLPAFDLKVVQAPVTNADANPQFKTWEETLLDLFRRCMKKDFEIALIGAGWYSLPLGDLLFQSGKQVIVVNAHIQLLFGIKGGRWDANQAWGHITNLGSGLLRKKSLQIRKLLILERIPIGNILDLFEKRNALFSCLEQNAT